jgi:hypothetical protein
MKQDHDVLVIEDKKYFDTVVAHAKAIGFYDKRENKNGMLESRLEYLEKYGGEKTRVRLFKDFAPFSFGFVVEQKNGEEWRHLFTGGLIFHGPHDGFGNGGGPTYAVAMAASVGWSIHT